MFVLDTDHATFLGLRESAEGDAIRRRAIRGRMLATTIVTYEEQMRGWLAFVAGARNVGDQVHRYARLNGHIEFYRQTAVLPFDDASATQFQKLGALKLRVGTMDLKIASIALANRETLLTRNAADFRGIPGLTIEDWSA